MSTQVHPLACVEKGAELGDDVRVGPYAYVGPRVKIGKGTILHAHAHVEGETEIGEGNLIFPYAGVGVMPQDLKYKGEPTLLKIGHRNQIREFSTIHPGTVQGGNVTSIGNENLIMAYAHIAHDCIVGNRCIMTNNATLAGHITLEDFAILGGFVAVHQFVRIGSHAIVSAGSLIARDVPPFTIAAGRVGDGALYGLNSIGLRRRSFSKETIMAIKRAYRTAFRSGLKAQEAIETLRRDHKDLPEALQLADFMANTKRGVLLDASRHKKRKGESPEGTEEV